MDVEEGGGELVEDEGEAVVVAEGALRNGVRFVVRSSWNLEVGVRRIEVEMEGTYETE